ncbi:TPM domain-containing protein [bacterium SCSIO 12741]|nr:TPM domain-containing protein [bacterium SCSIO 12741]
MNRFTQKIRLNEQQQEAIRTEVQHLERETSGELVIYLARRSDNYSDAIWYLGTLFAILSTASVGAMSYLWMLPAGLSQFDISLFVLSITLTGVLIPFLFPRIRVALMHKNNVLQRVITKAHDVFLQEEVFQTSERIGILIYISFLEHQVHVMGDKGINSKLTQEDWNEVVAHIIAGIKSKDLEGGIIQAIKQCKSLLLAKGFTATQSQINELRDGIIIE